MSHLTENMGRDEFANLPREVRALRAENVTLKDQIRTLLRELDRRDGQPSVPPITAPECQAFVDHLGGLKKLGKYLDSDKSWNPSTVKWWTKRGVPPGVQLMYHERFVLLRDQLNRAPV